MTGPVLVATPLAVPVLQPIRMTPHRPSTATAPVEFLSTIERVEINNTVERDGVVYYVLDVFLQRHKNRIPTNKRPEINRDEPDFQLEKRFTDFADMRHRVWCCVQEKHQGGKCSFCDQYMDFIVFSFAQPRLIVKLGTGTRSRKRLLTTFCNEFIRMAVGSQAELRQPRQTAPCRGLHVSPAIVERFFRRE